MYPKGSLPPRQCCQRKRKTVEARVAADTRVEADVRAVNRDQRTPRGLGRPRVSLPDRRRRRGRIVPTIGAPVGPAFDTPLHQLSPPYAVMGPNGEDAHLHHYNGWGVHIAHHNHMLPPTTHNQDLVDAITKEVDAHIRS